MQTKADFDNSRMNSKYAEELTEDLQYDLALMIAHNSDLDLQEAYTAELKRRHAPMPVRCKLIYDTYAFQKKRLVFDLEG